MSNPSLTIALPTADRPTTHRFYREVFGFEAFGEPADDGVPEPLQFWLDERTSLMFIPPGGFGWVTAGNETAPRGVSECLLSFATDDVDALAATAEAAGGTVVSPAQQQAWGYVAVIADPDGHLWQLMRAAG